MRNCRSIFVLLIVLFGLLALTGCYPKKNLAPGSWVDQYPPYSPMPWWKSETSFIRHIRAHNVQVIRIGDKMRLILHADDFFEPDNNTVIQEQINTLAEITDLIRQHGFIVVSVIAYSDNIGTDRHKLWQTRRRARNLAAYLWSQGLAYEALLIKAGADTEPVASDATVEGSYWNRRIEITLRRPSGTGPAIRRCVVNLGRCQPIEVTAGNIYCWCP